MEELWYRFKYFIEDNKTAVSIFLLIVGVAVLSWVALSIDPDDNEMKLDEQTLGQKLDEYEDMKREASKYFSLITYNNSGISEQRPIIDLTLYLKTPYESKEVIRDQIHNIIEMYKQQYNISKTQFLAGVRVFIYTRYYDYENDLDPEFSALYYYTHLDDKEVKDLRRREKRGEPVDITDIHWVNTSELKKVPDYDKDYTFTLKYEPYDIDVVALSDEEYEFYMKLEKYKYITGQNSRAISLYLSWEYGIPIKTATNSIIQQFENFLQRQYKTVGNNKNPWKARYYDYESRLVTENPALFLYGKHGVVASNNIEAIQILIKINPSKYRDVFIDYYMENDLSEELDEIENLDKLNEISEKLENILEEATDENDEINPDGIDLNDYNDVLQDLE